MNMAYQIPQGNELVTVQLTVKEAMALGGYRFPTDRKISASAKTKLRKAIETKLLEQPYVHYHELNM